MVAIHISKGCRVGVEQIDLIKDTDQKTQENMQVGREPANIQLVANEVV